MTHEADELQPIPCGFCYENLAALSISKRHAHYERHLNEDDAAIAGNHVEGSKSAPIDLESVEVSYQRPKAPNASKGVRSGNKSKKPGTEPTQKKRFQLMKETDHFWYPEQGSPPPTGFIPGLIPLLRKALLKGHDRGLVRRAVLCYDKAVLVHRELWDASWGCGYRNFMMACSVLMSQQEQPLYFPMLDSPLAPGIRNLQLWIEDAWMHGEGFDPEGQQQLVKLSGTRKWIGTSDLWVAFAFRGIPAQLVDFDLRNKPQGSQILTDWIVKYFSPPKSDPKPENAFSSITVSPIVVTEKMPIILQHDGHSRTVVGYEMDRHGAVNLLVFDPAYKPAVEIRNLALEQYMRSRAAQSASASSSPSLKRKRSLDGAENAPDIAGPSRPKKAGTSSKILSPLKNGLQKAGGNREDPYSMLKKFRLEAKHIGKKQQYQILYFPMTAPLTDKEQQGMKTVRSMRIS